MPDALLLFSRRKTAMIKMLLMVGLGSFAGGVLRFLLTRFVQINTLGSFPWGTTAVNLLGCLVLGILYGLFNRGFLLNTETRLFLTVGLCGGFTTFSTLMSESFLLLKEGNFPSFFAYTLLSFAGGLVAIGLGYLAAR
nr:fluoride efflux transporter CrcB [uncultured Akkermansia sp.]